MRGARLDRKMGKTARHFHAICRNGSGTSLIWYCLQNAATLQINFCLMRGKSEFGGVPSSKHLGKIIVNNVYAHSESEARECLRNALLKLFKVASIPHDANRYFEKWIGVKRA